MREVNVRVKKKLFPGYIGKSKDFLMDTKVPKMLLFIGEITA